MGQKIKTGKQPKTAMVFIRSGWIKDF